MPDKRKIQVFHMPLVETRKEDLESIRIHSTAYAYAFLLITIALYKSEEHDELETMKFLVEFIAGLRMDLDGDGDVDLDDACKAWDAAALTSNVCETENQRAEIIIFCSTFLRESFPDGILKVMVSKLTTLAGENMLPQIKELIKIIERTFFEPRVLSEFTTVAIASVTTREDDL